MITGSHENSTWKRQLMLVFIIAAFMVFSFTLSMTMVYAEEGEDEPFTESEMNYVGIPNAEKTLTDINGDKVSTLADGKPKILFFFNLGCKRCKAVEGQILNYGLNTDDVDFIMAEAANLDKNDLENSLAARLEDSKKFFAECEIQPTRQCYGAVDDCWYYLRRCGYTDDTTKKPIIVYISEDNEILGYTWNYTDIYKGAMKFGIKLEKGEHQWEDIHDTDPVTGVTCDYRMCSVCGKSSISAVEPAKTEFVYNGKAQSVLKDAEFYTVTGGCKTGAGNYEAIVSLKDTNAYEWNDGSTEPKVIKWSIHKASQKPVITTTSRTFKRSVLKKKSQAFSLKVSGAKGAKSFVKVSGSSRLKVSKTTGKVTVRKGTKKGTYKIKVKVNVAATSNYKAGTSVVKIVRVRVK